MENDEGHYAAAVKLNASWSIFDEKKSKPHFVSSKKKFSVHSLLFTKEFKRGHEKQPEIIANSDRNIGSLADEPNADKENTVRSVVKRKTTAKEHTVKQILVLRNGLYDKNSRIAVNNTLIAFEASRCI